MITVEKTELDGVMKITQSIFVDHRGQYKELYNEKDYEQFGIRFVTDDVSISKYSVLRGIHGDNQTWKLVSCPYGEIQLVVVDCNEYVPYFGKWESFSLTGDNGIQILVPPNYGLGHLVLSESAVFQYKQSQYSSPERQFTYRYDDPRFNIEWLLKNPVLSERDNANDIINVCGLSGDSSACIYGECPMFKRCFEAN